MAGKTLSIASKVLSPELEQGGTSQIPANDGINYALQRDIGQDKMSSIAAQLANTRIPDYAAKMGDAFQGVQKLMEGVAKVAVEVQHREQVVAGIETERAMQQVVKDTGSEMVQNINASRPDQFTQNVFSKIDERQQQAMAMLDQRNLTPEQRARITMHTEGAFAGMKQRAQEGFFTKQGEYATNIVQDEIMQLEDKLKAAPMSYELLTAEIANLKEKVEPLARDWDGKPHAVLSEKMNRYVDRMAFKLADARIAAMAEHGMTSDIGKATAVLEQFKVERELSQGKPMGGSDHEWTKRQNILEAHIDGLYKKADNDMRQQANDRRVAAQYDFDRGKTAINESVSGFYGLVQSGKTVEALKSLDQAQKILDKLPDYANTMRNTRVVGGKHDETARALHESKMQEVQIMQRAILRARESLGSEQPMWARDAKSMEQELAGAFGHKAAGKVQ